MEAAFAPALLAPADCRPAVLDPVGPIGRAEETILVNWLVIMLAIVEPITIATAGFAGWLRACNPRARRRPDRVFSGAFELVTWSVLVLLGGVT